MGCVFSIVVPILPHAEFGPNDHREGAPHFTKNHAMLTLSFSTFFFQFWLFSSIIDRRSAIEVLISFSSDFSVSGSVIFSGRRLWNMILRDRYWVLSLVARLTVIKTTKKCCTSLSCYFYALRTATVRTPRRLPPYGPSCLVLNFFSPNPRFWAG